MAKILKQDDCNKIDQFFANKQVKFRYIERWLHITVNMIEFFPWTFFCKRNVLLEEYF